MDKTDYESIGKIISSLHMGVTIIDEKGTFVYVDNSYFRVTGLNRSDLEGKNVFDREVLDMFSPCISEQVFIRQEKITAVQRVKNSEELFVTGVPVFDENGEISMVICYSSWEVSSYDDLYGTYSRAGIEKSGTNAARHMDELKSVGVEICESSKSKDSMRLIDIFADAGRSAYIYGPEGAGKHYSAVAAYSKRGGLYEYSCRFTDDNEAARELLDEGGVIKGRDCSVLVLKDIEYLSPRIQRKLIEIAEKKKLILVGLSLKSLEELRNEGRITEGFYHFFKPYQVRVYPLSERADDTKEFIRYYTKLYNHMYSRNVTISPRAENLMICHNWSENINELRGVIERLILTAKRDKINVYNLPEGIAGRDAREFREDTSLKHLLEMYEGDIIREAYKENPTSVALAKKLEISQATAVRKIHKYIGEDNE